MLPQFFAPYGAPEAIENLKDSLVHRPGQLLEDSGVCSGWLCGSKENDVEADHMLTVFSSVLSQWLEYVK